MAGPPGAAAAGQAPSFRGKNVSLQEVGRMLEGTSLGVYELEQFVGGGGMGAVFRARDTTLDRTVALKVLFAESSGDEELVRRFRNEAHSAARLDHENIGRVHAVGYERGWHFIVFEYIEGRNLRELVAAEGPFGAGRTVAVAVQIAEALAHASEREVVHRDIKPSNIIITPDGQAKLVDMGLARLHQVAEANDLTVSGMTLGTFDYISPEQARDPRIADVRSDLYSLGCTLYFLLAGRPPFADGTMAQKLLQHQQDAPVPIEQIRPDVPRQLAAAVARLMEKSPDDRYQHPSGLVADLSGLADDYGIPVTAPRITVVEAPTAPSWRISDHVPWVVPLAALAAIVAALFVKQSAGPPAAVVTRPAVSEITVAGRSIRPPVGGLAAAVAEAKNGDLIELDSSGERIESPIAVIGKRVVVRAANGQRPVVILSSRGLQAGGRVGDGLVRIESGGLTIEGVEVRGGIAEEGASKNLFVLDGASGLELRDATVGFRRESADTATPYVPSAATQSVAVQPAVAQPVVIQPVVIQIEDADQPVRRSVRLHRAKLSTDGTVIESAGGGEIEVDVVSCSVATPGRFLVVDGGVSPGSAVRLSLEQSDFACDEGVVCLLDSPARPRAASLHATARECRFAVRDGAALIVQSGIEAPEAYQASVEWIDVGSRYEGSDVFRRIDGAAERIDVDFAAAATPMEHSSRIGGGEAPPR